MANGTVKVSQVDVLTTSGVGTISIVPPATNTNRTLTLPDQTATLATLTTPSFATTIGVGGATASASGAGISFPATQSASTDANTLDDYEQGTFTPTAYGGTSAGTTTYSVQQGHYTKIGRQVTAVLLVEWTAMTGTGALVVGGLPFASANITQNYSCGSILVGGLNWGGGTMITPINIVNTTTIQFYYQADDASVGAQQCVNEASDIRITITYFAAD